MTGIIEAMLTRSNETLKVTNLHEAAREQTLRDCQRQLTDITTLEDCLRYIGIDLKTLCQRGSARLIEIKPLQEKARVATSLIRGHIYIAEMRSATGQTAWQALDEKFDATAALPAQAATEKGASLTRVKKNLHSRKKQNQSKNPDEKKSGDITQLEKDITNGMDLAARVKKNLKNSTAL